MKHFSIVVVMVALLSTVAFAGGQGESMEAAAAKPKVVMAFSATEDSAEEVMGRMAPVEEYLEEAANIEIDWFEVTDHTTLVEAIRADKVDMCTFSPFRYLVAQQRVDVEPIAMPKLIEEGGGSELKTNYWSVFVVRNDSPLQSMDDVIANAGDLTIAFDEPASTSGSLVPRSGLLAHGMDADKDFKEVIVMTGDAQVAVALQNGNVDIAGMGGHHFPRLEEKGFVQKGELRILWRSPDIPLSAVFVRGDMDEAIKQRLKDAYENIDHQLATDVLVRKAGLFEYVPLTTDEYDTYIKDLRAAAKSLGFIE